VLIVKTNMFGLTRRACIVIIDISHPASQPCRQLDLHGSCSNSTVEGQGGTCVISTTTTDRLMNTPEVAEYLGMKESWVRDNWLSQGIPFYRLGGQLRCKREELEKWLKGKQAA
jgi:excisionase family DNA binding protein